jgi:CRP-like cAMP-binding protein
LVEVMKDFEYLKRLPLFSELSLDEMKMLYDHCDEASFAPGDVLIEQGKPGRALYVVRTGQVSVLRSDGFAENLLAELGKGAYIGEMSLLEDAPTSARVVAKTDVTAFRIDKNKFQHLLDADDRFAVKIYREFSRELSARLREANRKLGSGA